MKMRALGELEQAVVQELKLRHILEPLNQSMLPTEKLENYGICLCSDLHHLKRRVGYYDNLFSGADRHPITEHGGGAALAIRNDERLWRYKFQEHLFTAVRKRTKFFGIETHLACALVQDTWDYDPYRAVKKHEESVTHLSRCFQQLVNNRDLQLEHYMEYTLHAEIKRDVTDAFDAFKPEEVVIFPFIDTFRYINGAPVDRTYKLCRAKLLEHRTELDQLVPAILSGDKKVA